MEIQRQPPRKKVNGDPNSGSNIGDLPVSILQHIMFLLPCKDAVRTSCILSKEWNRLVWSSLPVISFDFDQHRFFKKNRLPTISKYAKREENQRLESAFIDMVETSMQTLCGQQRFLILKFKLLIIRFNTRISSFMDRWIKLLANNNVYFFNLRVYYPPKEGERYNFPSIGFASSVGSLKILKLQGCNLNRNSLFYENEISNQVPLSLENIRLFNVLVVPREGEDVVQNLLSKCPLINNLVIYKCWGFRFLRLTCHTKLKNIQIYVASKRGFSRLEMIAVHSPSLETLIFETWCSSTPLLVHATLCKGLRELKLRGVIFRGKDELQNLVSSFPLLETLSLKYCTRLETLRSLSHPCLKTLQFDNNYHLDKLDVIDTPNLVSYDFTVRSKRAPRHLFSKDVAFLSSIKESKHTFRLQNFHLNTSWFLQLREYMGHFSKHKVTMCLQLDYPRRLQPLAPMFEFNVEELIGKSIAPYNIENLLLDVRTFSLAPDVNLVDGLFWSFHPKTLTVTSLPRTDQIRFNEFLKFILDILIKRGEDPSCCNSSGIKCWRHYLKDVMMINMQDGSKTSLLDATSLHSSAFATCREVILSLNWQY